MKNDDLILKGNQLICAAKDGKVGLIADEIIAMQKSYITYSKITPTAKTLMMVCGGLSVLSSIFMLFGIVFGGGDFILVMGSIIGGIGGWIALTMPFTLGRRAKEYTAMIEREYPRLPKPSAA